jgi:Fur family ferric uptake transcriptional regulator
MERSTKQKRVILDAVVEAKRPLTPAEICELAHGKCPSLNLATVYRNLRGLQESGSVHRVAIPGEPDRYESKEAAAHHHHHFQCESCRKVFDIPGCSGGRELLSAPGFKVRRHEVVLYGTCSACT